MRLLASSPTVREARTEDGEEVGGKQCSQDLWGKGEGQGPGKGRRARHPEEKRQWGITEVAKGVMERKKEEQGDFQERKRVRSIVKEGEAGRAQRRLCTVISQEKGHMLRTNRDSGDGTRRGGRWGAERQIRTLKGGGSGPQYSLSRKKWGTSVY